MPIWCAGRMGRYWAGFVKCHLKLMPGNCNLHTLTQKTHGRSLQNQEFYC